MIIIFSTKKRFFIYIFTLILLVSSFLYVKSNHFNRRSITASSNESSAPVYIAIVIDDFGNNSSGTAEMLSLPIPFTGAVMPSMPNTKCEAELLHSSGKAVILHQPMEPHKGLSSWLGSSPIMNNYSSEKALNILKSNLSQVPHCVGINNHMGSKVSENKSLMLSINSLLSKNNMFYLDSVTTGKSVTSQVFNDTNVPLLTRDVFLDSTQDISKIEQNLKKTAEISHKKGYAIAIGHVGAEGGIVTATAIKNIYPSLEKENIKFVTLPELIQNIN